MVYSDTESVNTVIKMLYIENGSCYDGMMILKTLVIYGKNENIKTIKLSLFESNLYKKNSHLQWLDKNDFDCFFAIEKLYINKF